MRIRRWAVPSLVTVAALSLAAFASAGVSTVKSPNHLVDPFGRKTVSCPEGSHTLGGGFRTDPGVLAQLNRPRGGRLWQAEGFLDPDQKIHLQVFARCETNSAGGVKRVSSSKAVPKDTRTIVDARCPSGRQVLAGGYATSPIFTNKPDPDTSGEVAVDTSKRVGSSIWRVAGLNEGNPRTRLVAYAVCGKSGTRGKFRTASASASIVSSRTSATAKCKRGSHTLGGGFSTPGEMRDVFPDISVAAPSGSRGWKVTLGTNLMVLPRSAERRASGLKIRAYAYCAKNGG